MISGFTIVRNADKLYFPIEASIRSLLPLVDEMIVALGKGDEDDKTHEIIKSINDPKIKVIPRVWSEEDFKESRILAKETNFALSQCQGEWCIYLQADEVLHQNDYTTVRKALQTYEKRDDVEGLLLSYHHFWADYDHHLPYHGWYDREIRIIKNGRKIRSIKDAQSFRHANDKKLSVVEIDARVYHYGWVRPPHLMQSKKKVHDGIHNGLKAADEQYAKLSEVYNYGPIGKIPKFKGSHPTVMNFWMQNHNWAHLLNYGKSWVPDRPLNKHEKWKYRFLSLVENKLLAGRRLFGYSNWHTVKP